MSESYAMHLVFLCVIEVCTALDILILDRISKKTKERANTGDMTVTDVKHHDKTGLGSESWKHNQPLDVETEGFDYLINSITFETIVLVNCFFNTIFQ